jgi:penicillin-binding protein 1C
MGLGGVGITLQDLAQLYAGLARLGTTKPLREIANFKDERESMRLMDQAAAWQVGNVLIGTPPPENGTHNRIAFKTGTSYGYRDAWSVGFDGKITIGVWVGRPDGAPVPGLIGRVAAAPILFDAFARTGKIAEGPQGRAGCRQCQAAAAAAPVPPDGRTGADRQRPGSSYPVPDQRLAH